MMSKRYPAEVAREVMALRPELETDAGASAVRAILTADPTLSAQEVLDLLDESSSLAGGRAQIRVVYVEGGNACADCCTAVAAIASDGEIVTAEQAAALDAAVGSMHEPTEDGWCSDPRESHRYEPADAALAADWRAERSPLRDEDYASVAAWIAARKNQRLQRAASHVDAVDLGDGRWAHYADETGTWWVVSAAELAELCDYLDDEDPQISGNAYSHWCAGTASEEMPEGWTPDEPTTYSVVTGEGGELCSGVSAAEIKKVAQAHADSLGETVYYSAAGGADLDPDDDEDIGTAVEPRTQAVAPAAHDHHLHGGDACTDGGLGACSVCGVVLDPCATCGGRGYHRAGCSDPECEEPPEPDYEYTTVGEYADAHDECTGEFTGQDGEILPREAKITINRAGDEWCAGWYDGNQTWEPLGSGSR